MRLQQRTVKIVVLVPPANVVLAIHAIQDAVGIEHGYLKGGADGGSSSRGLEESRSHACRLQDILVDGIGTLHELGGEGLAIPRGRTHSILKVKIGFVADFKRVEACVFQVVDDGL